MGFVERNPDMSALLTIRMRDSNVSTSAMVRWFIEQVRTSEVDNTPMALAASDLPVSPDMIHEPATATNGSATAACYLPDAAGTTSDIVFTVTAPGESTLATKTRTYTYYIYNIIFYCTNLYFVLIYYFS